MTRPDVSEERKRQILHAAAQVFDRRGIEAARMEEIAQEANLSVGGVYWYFKSKDAIIHALLDKMFNADLDGLHALLVAEGSVRDRLITYAREELATARSPLRSELYSLATRSDSACAQVLEYLNELKRLLAALIQQGIDRNELRPLDPVTAAQTLMAAYEGFAELAMLGFTLSDPERDLLAMLNLILDGMSQPPKPATTTTVSTPVSSSDEWQAATQP